MAKIDMLSSAKVRSIKAPGYYLDGRGLYLQVRNETSKSWLQKYSIDKKPRAMGLGSAFDVSLAEARDERDRLRKLIRIGIDPLEQRELDKQAKKLERLKIITFRDACTRFIAENRSGWRNIKHAGQWATTLESYAYPVLGDLPVQAIDTALIMRVLRPLWNEKPVTAGRLRGRIEAVLNACKAFGEYVGENPARWRGNLDAVLPKKSKVRTVRNHPALPYAELPAFMQDLRSHEGIAALALEFQILTASRPGNALGARWDEIDRKAAVWTIPAERMKGGTEHKVSLSPAALAVLDRMDKIRNGEFIFYSPRSRRPLSDAATSLLLNRMGRHDFVPHGFRSTFRDWAAERGYQDAVAEAALAHKVSDAVIAAYKRTTFTELRKKMLEDWAAFATSDPTQSADVLPFGPIATAN